MVVNGERVTKNTGDQKSKPLEWGLMDAVVPFMAGEKEYTPWAMKQPKLVWRGSTTGGHYHYKRPSRGQDQEGNAVWLPRDMHYREHLALLGLDYPELLNVSLLMFNSIKRRIYLPKLTSKVFVDRERALAIHKVEDHRPGLHLPGQSLSAHDQQEFKFIIDLEGDGCSGRFMKDLALGIVVGVHSTTQPVQTNQLLNPTLQTNPTLSNSTQPNPT